MTATILDGKRIARDVRHDLALLAQDHEQRHGHPAGLAIVRAGDDPASAVYTQSLQRAAQKIGVVATALALPADVDDDGLRSCLEALNADDSVQGILTQLPLPPHLSPATIAQTIDPRKDVDGISLRSAGNLFLKLPSFVPSTCAAVLEILDRCQIPLVSRRAVVVGASNVVGKPLSFLLLHRDATVTTCHIYTRDLAAWTLQADVLVVAAGKAGLITGAMVKPGAVVIDVGINVRDDGSITGDVDFASVVEVAGAITPVPGGVGQLTNLMLLKQTLLARDLWSA
ncbi:MAG: methenyltetrahydrofolate cyclohydrolase / methylenetetrahydrofolate dehydrogenase (NADP+) [Ktedonobacterales bacterium]|jgi:methylenetetrahydrofolate dehydrogenase (NADP+)/methenyltetrahydrofolate cyclohydrolase|nr:MAG: methenyltetrahydrofolate cyclohydrolase / methylenetetrahydrofolate dehydrogenase (NADP+) [Ktedonobacterales bacterium]